MFCKNCGNQLEPNTTFCSKCGFQQNNQMPQNGNVQQTNVVDNGGLGWGLLGCCIPVVGLILFLVWKDQKPKTAKAAGIGALVWVIFCAIMYVMAIVLGFLSSTAA